MTSPAHGWPRRGDRRRPARSATPRSCVADGARFPSADDCVQHRGRRATEASSTSSSGDGTHRRRPRSCSSRSAASGYVDAVVVGDGCGRWKVLYDGIESYEQGLESRAEARGAGLEAELELEPPG